MTIRYPAELLLSKANISGTEAPFLDLHLSILDGYVTSEIYNKCDDFDFDIIDFPSLNGDVHRTTFISFLSTYSLCYGVQSLD